MKQPKCPKQLKLGIPPLKQQKRWFFTVLTPFLAFGTVEPLLTDTSLLRESMLTSKGDSSFLI